MTIDAVEVVLAHHWREHTPGARVVLAPDEARNLVRAGYAHYAPEPTTREDLEQADDDAATSAPPQARTLRHGQGG